MGVYQPTYRSASGELKHAATWWLRYSSAGTIIRESSGTTSKSEAKRLLRERAGRVAQGQQIHPGMHSVRFGELLEDLLNEYAAQKRKSLVDVTRHVQLHIRPALGKLKAAEIDTATLERYVVRKQREGLADASINRHLAAIRRAYSLATRRTPPKAVASPWIPYLGEPAPREVFIDQHQFMTLLTHLPDYLAAPVALLWHCGARKNEVLNLTWQDVTDDEIRILTSKNGDFRSVPVTSSIALVLSHQRVRRDTIKKDLGVDCPWVFSTDVGKQITYPYHTWRKATEAAGLRSLRLHDLRRSFVVRAARANVPTSVIASLVGHRAESMTQRYRIVDAADHRNALRLLEGVR